MSCASASKNWASSNRRSFRGDGLLRLACCTEVPRPFLLPHVGGEKNHSSNRNSGLMNSHDAAPNSATPAVKRNEPDQPHQSARYGVIAATSAPPSWQPIFITPDTEPAEERP